MGRVNWNTIKQSKMFYVVIYRRSLSALMISLVLNCIFSLLIYYVYLSRPEPDYYATSGIAPPIQLTVMAEPNKSSVALLPPDPVEEVEARPIPQ